MHGEYAEEDEYVCVNHRRLQERTAAERLDAVVSTTAENLMYLTGFDSVHLGNLPHSGALPPSCPRTQAGVVFVCGLREVDRFLDADEPIREAVARGGALSSDPRFKEHS